MPLSRMLKRQWKISFLLTRINTVLQVMCGQPPIPISLNFWRSMSYHCIWNSVLIASRLVPLQEVVAISKTKDAIDLVKVININEVFDRRVVKRLRTLEVFPSCGPSKNLAMADPEQYFHGIGTYPTYICERDTRHPARFFIIGTSRYSALLNGDKARQAAVTMSDRTFPRAAAFIAAVTKQEIISIPTFRDGMSFSTYRDTGKYHVMYPNFICKWSLQVLVKGWGRQARKSWIGNMSPLDLSSFVSINLKVKFTIFNIVIIAVVLPPNQDGVLVYSRHAFRYLQML